MKRLTTDAPDGSVETMLNFVFSQDGWAHIRHDGNEESVPLTQWAKAQCILHGCGEFSAETPREIDEEICDCMMMDFPDCPIALAYCFAVQACHLRDRLKMYEDVLFSKDGTERFTLDEIKELFYLAEATGWQSIAKKVRTPHDGRTAGRSDRDIAADRAPKMELSEWRKIGKALDALEGRSNDPDRA